MSKKFLQIKQDWLDRCVRCGSCRNVCPVFNATKEEPSVSRGKISLIDMIQKGYGKLDREAALLFKKCTTCLRCQEICAMDVPYEEIILKAREAATEKFGLFPQEKAVTSILKNENMLDGAGNLSRLAYLFLKPSKSPQNAVTRISIPGKGKAVVPAIKNGKFNYKDRLFPAMANKKAKLIYFPGCMFSRAYVDTSRNIIKVLNHLGYEVFVPSQIVCCGAPSLHAGDTKGFKKLREKNTEVLNTIEADGIVTGCATCCHNLKHNYNDLNKPVFQFLEIVVENLETLKNWKAKKPLKITWHHPCHIVRGQNIDKSTPRKIFETISGITYIEMQESDNCCGMGGSFKMIHPAISDKIQERKSLNIIATGADTVITECPGCIMNIAEGLENQKSNMPCKHTADILAECIGEGTNL
ncbi:(Fe-S)-binding protein [Desulfurobacterium sp.]